MLNAPSQNGVKELEQQTLDTVRAQSVQDLPTVGKDGGQSGWWGNSTPRGPILPAWGTRERERVLRLYDRHDYNTLWQGAKANLTKKLAATPWQIDGGRNTTNYFQDVLREAQFGQGWEVFLKRFAADYLRFDGGAYAELIAPGDPRKAPTGPITGIAALDSYYCWPTGDPDFPVIYWSRFGKLHTLHYTRVLHMVDMPDGDQWNPGYGLCALSRAIAVVERQIYMGRYIVSNLDDKPSPGVVIGNNITQQDRDRMIANYQREQGSDEPPPWGRVMWVYNLDPSKPATLDNFTFSRPPEKFDYPVYMQVDVDDMALAIGVDPQDLRPLSSKSTGTAAQSQVLHEKANGKTYGDFLIELERRMNSILPDTLEFTFDTHDAQAAQTEATTAQLWAGVATILAPMIGNQLTMQLLADNVKPIAKVMTDDAGQMITLTDLDPQPSGVSGQITAQVMSEAPPPAPDAGKPGVTATDTTPNASGGKGLETDEQRRWFFAHINMPDTGASSTPVVMDFDEYAARRGVSRQDTMMDSALHRSSSNVSGAARRSQLKIEDERNHAATAKLADLRTEYEKHVSAGLMRPPSRDEALIRRAQGHEDNASVQAARRLLDKRGIQWNKDFDTTREQFVAHLIDLLHGSTSDDLTRRRAGTVMRGLLNSAGKQARKDGLVDGGVTTGLSDADLNDHAVWLAQQSGYVTDFLDSVYKSGLTDDAIDAHAELWANKSLQGAYYGGVQSADANGTYEFTGSDGKESCATCQSLKGTKMRMSEWTAQKLRPGLDTDAFDCGGWNCKHRLERVTAADKGLETDEQRRWFFAHLGNLAVGATGGASLIDRTGSGRRIATLEGHFETDRGSPGSSEDSLNRFLQKSNGPLSYAIADPNVGLVKVDYGASGDRFTVDKSTVASEAKAFVSESQNIQYSKDYLLSVAKDRATENGVHLSDTEVEKAFNQQYAIRARAIQTTAQAGGVRLSDAQTRRLDEAASGHYLDMVYSRDDSERGTLTPTAPPRNRGHGRLTGGALREARRNFLHYVGGIDNI